MKLRGVDFARQEALFHLQEYARRFNKNEVPIPIPVEQIAELYFGLTIERKELNEQISGQLFAADKKIVLNQRERLTRQRFTTAHELGHFCLHSALAPISSCPSGFITEVETEANRFAAALLLPANLVLLKLAIEVNTRAEIAKSEDRIYELTPGELDVLGSRLAVEFLVSKAAMNIFLSKGFNIRRPSQLSFELGIESA
jgi:hypothetical protein